MPAYYISSACKIRIQAAQRNRTSLGVLVGSHRIEARTRKGKLELETQFLDQEHEMRKVQLMKTKKFDLQRQKKAH